MQAISTTNTTDLTQSQTLLWTGQMLLPKSPMYNMAMRYDLKDAINVAAFQAAFQVLVNKSDVLRTVILTENGSPKQQVKATVNYDLEYLDLRQTIDQNNTLKNWLNERTQRNFNLSEQLFDSAIIQFSDTHFVWYFNQHHLVTDGWSLTVLYQAMAKFYQLALNNELENATQLTDFQAYINFEKEKQQQAKKESVVEYWENKLTQLTSPPRLYGQSGVENHSQSERVLVDLGAERSAQLLALTKEKDLRAFTSHMSLFNIFSTVLFSYLYRISGQQNLVIGAPSHNRPTLVFKQTPGLFMEIFPMQTDIEKNDTFMDVFGRVRTEASNYLRNAQMGRSSAKLSGSFNVLLNYISGTFSDFNDIPMQSEWLLPNHTDPQHHLRVQIHDFDKTGRIQLHFDMNTAVFDDELRQNAPQHFVRLLDHFIENRTQPITAGNILSEAEKTHLLKGLNDTKKAFPNPNQHLLTQFEAQVKRTPNAPAIVFENTIWSYQKFNEKANQLGRFLHEKGIGKEEVVAVCMERSLEMPLAIYGILKAGAAYLPIAPDTPAARLNFMLKDADIKAFLTQEKITKTLEIADPNVLHLDSDWAKIANEKTTNLDLTIPENSLAYVIYTSGSTGKPKGVSVEHHSICNRLNWIKDLETLDKTDIYLQKTPYTFDVSVPEFFWPLQLGAQLVMAAPEGHKNPAYLVDIIQQKGVTNIHFVPSMLAIFLEEKGLENCTTLRRVFVSGEAISVPLQNRFFEHFTIPLHNLYGPTEAAVEVTRWQCQPNSTDAVVPIGVPVANTQIYILDPHLQPVPKGTPGELYIAGKQVARGYLNRPELTAERFVDDPYSDQLNAKMYRSGDLARHRSDGVIEYLGRVDFQVKLRGYRIELGEIEAALENHSAVAQAVVILHEKAANEQYLLAYYTGVAEVTSADLKLHLAAHLPEYMVPSHFVHLTEFPLGSSGKVNRKALPKVTISTTEKQVEYAAPEGDLEELLAELWAELLQVERVGRHDNFIEMGGHSLTAIRLMSRIIETFELTLPINLVFKKPTIATYAAHIEVHIQELLAEMEE